MPIELGTTQRYCDRHSQEATMRFLLVALVFAPTDTPRPTPTPMSTPEPTPTPLPRPGIYIPIAQR